MFVFKKNMIYINKLSPTVKLPFKEVKLKVLLIIDNPKHAIWLINYIEKSYLNLIQKKK